MTSTTIQTLQDENRKNYRKLTKEEYTEKRRSFIYVEKAYLPLTHLTKYTDELFRRYKNKIPKSALAWRFIERFINADLPRDKDDFGNIRIWINASTWHSRKLLAERYSTTENAIRLLENKLVEIGMFVRSGGHHGNTRNLALSPEIVSFFTGALIEPVRKETSQKKSRSVKASRSSSNKGGTVSTLGVNLEVSPPEIPLGVSTRDTYIGVSTRDTYRISSKVNKKKISSKPLTTTLKNITLINDASIKKDALVFTTRKRMIDIYRQEICKKEKQSKNTESENKIITDLEKQLREKDSSIENSYLSFLQHVENQKPLEKAHSEIYRRLSGVIGDGFTEGLRYFKKMASYKGIEYTIRYLDFIRYSAKKMAESKQVKIYTFNFSEIKTAKSHADIEAQIK